MQNPRILTDGLAFPEGPVVLADGDLVVVEVKGGRVTRVAADGRKSTLADTGGGPNGLATGPDGALYLCNAGGGEWGSREGYTYGAIQRIDVETGAFDDLYTHCDGNPLIGPNDIVFDDAGGFWFTDLGKVWGREEHLGGVYYAQPDGSSIQQVHFPMGANGVGLSPAGDRVYVAETMTGRLWAWPLSAPGTVAGGRELVVGLPGYQLFDSLAVEAGGNVCVATLINGGITVVTPDGAHEHVAVPDEPMVTNIAFGGDDLTTAYLTLSSTGRVLVCDWPRPGLRLHH